MKVTQSITKKSNYSMFCQASFNSDVVLTLRNYDTQNKNSDEIIILSREETEAIVKLFRAMKNLRFPTERDLQFMCKKVMNLKSTFIFKI